MSDASFFDPATPLPPPPEPHFKVPAVARKVARVLSLLIAISIGEIMRGLLLVLLWLPARLAFPMMILAALAELHVVAVACQHGRLLLAAEAFCCLFATGLIGYFLPRFYWRLRLH
jgi:hypothetical protein